MDIEHTSNHEDMEALRQAHGQFQQQLLRQQENQLRLKEIVTQLQMCMLTIARSQQLPNPNERLEVARIAIKYMTQFNSRTGSYAAAFGAGVEQFTRELKDNEDRLAEKKTD